MTVQHKSYQKAKIYLSFIDSNQLLILNSAGVFEPAIVPDHIGISDAARFEFLAIIEPELSQMRAFS